MSGCKFIGVSIGKRGVAKTGLHNISFDGGQHGSPWSAQLHNRKGLQVNSKSIVIFALTGDRA